MDEKRQNTQISPIRSENRYSNIDSIVLDKGIFSNVFEKDIRRVFIYKKSERIAKAIHMIAPALKDVKPLRDRAHRISVELIDASMLPLAQGKEHLARELLALGSLLSMAKSAGIVSAMNADIIMREAHNLLQEIAGYEEPKVALDDAPSLASLAKAAPAHVPAPTFAKPAAPRSHHVLDIKDNNKGHSNGHESNGKDKDGRKEAILSLLTSRGPSYIKDLSGVIREVSEKTIQRELQALVAEGRVERTGERRWTTYSVPASEAGVSASAEAP